MFEIGKEEGKGPARRKEEGGDRRISCDVKKGRGGVLVFLACIIRERSVSEKEKKGESAGEEGEERARAVIDGGGGKKERGA